jgi:hypothetical protein
MAAQKAKTDDERIQNAYKYEPKLAGLSPEQVAELNKPLTVDEERAFKQLFSSVAKPILEKTGVLSLCAVSDDVRMWSHYADGHKGICLKFSLDDWNDVKANILPVCYRQSVRF